MNQLLRSSFSCEAGGAKRTDLTHFEQYATALFRRAMIDHASVRKLQAGFYAHVHVVKHGGRTTTLSGPGLRLRLRLLLLLDSGVYNPSATSTYDLHQDTELSNKT